MNTFYKNIKKIITAIFILAFCISLSPTQKVNAYQLNGHAYPSAMRGKITIYILPGLENIYNNIEGSTKQWARLSGINFSRTYDFNNPNLTQTIGNVKVTKIYANTSKRKIEVGDMLPIFENEAYDSGCSKACTKTFEYPSFSMLNYAK